MKRETGEAGAPGTGPTVGETGESGVLRRILDRLTAVDGAVLGPGDDAAVLSISGELVVTSDTMIEGPDFRLAWHSGFELGWKAAATNLSDVAAMGAEPVGLTVSLACPRETPVALLEEIAAGLDAACRTLAPGCGVVGGDLTNAPVLMIAVTALGELRGRAAVMRSGARPGHVLAYAGELGLAGLGLSLLFAESADTDGRAHARGLPALWEAHPGAISAQLAPTPPIPLGVVAAESGAAAMMDVSDSLSLDAARMARASRVRIELDPTLLAGAFGEQNGERVPLEAMLTGGEDHGLLAAFPVEADLPRGFHAIGTVRARGEGTGAVTLGDEPLEPRGWDPYGTRPQDSGSC